MRINAMRSAVCVTFPEPNCRLLQRILTMMQSVASHKTVNRMSISAVAACMAPLLLRSLLVGDCDLDNDFDVGGDGSVQLLQAAAAANHAQAIVITLLEEYDNIFGDHAVSYEPYTDSEESGSESEEITDDDDDDDDDDDYGDDSFDDDDVTEESNSGVDEDSENESSSTSSEAGENEYSKKVSGSSGSNSPQVDDNLEASHILSPSPPQTPLQQHDSLEGTEKVPNPDDAKMQSNSFEVEDDTAETSLVQRPSELSRGAVRSVRRPAVWGRTPAKKNLSMESIELPSDDESEIQKLESIKTDLQIRISNEATTNSHLQNSLAKQKHDLHERRLALEKEVARLQEQLQKEMDLRRALEAALRKSQLPLSVSSLIDVKTRAELEEIARAEVDVMNLKKNADDFEFRLNQQREQNSKIRHDIGNQLNQNPNYQSQWKEKQTDGGLVAISRTSENLSSRSKHDFYLDKPGNDKDNKQESLSSINTPLFVNQQADAPQNPKSTGILNMGSNVEMSTNRHVSRKSSTRGEGTNSTTSALSKLTNRLNFLKERRSQIASELQNLDKGRSSCQPVQNLEQCTTSEHHPQFIENSGNQQESKGQQSSGSYGVSYNNPNARISEGIPSVERGKSRSFPAGDKGHSKFPPRTHSR